MTTHFYSKPMLIALFMLLSPQTMLLAMHQASGANMAKAAGGLLLSGIAKWELMN